MMVSHGVFPQIHVGSVQEGPVLSDVKLEKDAKRTWATKDTIQVTSIGAR